MVISCAIGSGLAIVALTDERRRRFARMFRATTKHADMTLAQAAGEADRDVGQFTRQIDGQEGSLPTLERQTDEWWRWLGVVIADEFGLPRAVRRAAQLRRVSVQRKVQARMHLPRTKQERSA